MKKSSVTIACILALTASIATRTVFAADGDTKKEKTEATAPRRGGGANATPEARVDRMAKELSLNDDQKAKLKPIFEDETTKMKALRDDTTVAREDRRTKAQDIRKETDAKVKGVLTADQFSKWQEQRQQAVQRRRQNNQNQSTK
jgi:protein CpxP